MKLPHTEVKFYPDVKSQIGLSSLRVSCKRALSSSSALAGPRSTALLSLFKNETLRFKDMLFDDPMFNKGNLFLLFFSVIAVFYINNLSRINTLTCLSPVDRTCFS